MCLKSAVLLAQRNYTVESYGGSVECSNEEAKTGLEAISYVTKSPVLFKVIDCLLACWNGYMLSLCGQHPAVHVSAPLRTHDLFSGI